MIGRSIKYNSIVCEVERLKELQKKLKEDISKYKKITNLPFDSSKNGLSENDKEQLLNNFNNRLQKNSWIMKKIIYDIKRNFN